MKAQWANLQGSSAMGRWLIPILLLGLGACADSTLVEPELAPDLAKLDGGRSMATARMTGTVDLVWPGGRGAGAPDDDRTAQAEIVAFAGVPAGDPGPGMFTYRVLAADGTLHREIEVQLTWVGEENQQTNPGEIRFVGVVLSDTKPCGGSGSHGGGHDDGGTHDDGGCSHDDTGDTHDDGGCSHDDTGDTHDDGGCSHDDTGDTHDDGGSGGHSEPGGSGGGGVNGSDCRIGQIVIGWMMDGGTPAINGDRVSWKWMAPDAPKVAAIQAAIDAGTEIPWPCHLCEKVITGGNIQFRIGRQ